MGVERLWPSGCEITATIPNEEQPLVGFVRLNLNALTQYVNELGDTVELFHAIRELPHAISRHGWAFVPAKQAIVAIYNYRMAMDTVVTATTRASKHLSQVIDTKAMEAAKNEFRTQHPHTKELRQSILHQAELSGSQERIKQTKLREDQQIGAVLFGGGGAPQSNLIEGALQMTFQGRVYIQPLSREMASDMRQNALKFIGAFSAIGAAARLMRHG